MQELESFVAGTWTKGKGKHATLVNPSTEAPMAQTSTVGVDMRAALEFARTRGGPALRELSFAQRGEALKAASKALHAKRDELLTMAMENGGNTRSDAKFDVDGAIGTLAAYAELGASLGDARVLADGDGIQLGRSARLFGQHMYLPRTGAAVHINAFNFPAWGLAEKAATAWLAGMPVVSKPATSTALVAYAVARILDEAKVLPDGALSLVCGAPGDLLEHLAPDDVLAFTGSSHTGATLRGSSAVRERGTRLNVEADSLNAAVLGPDVDEGSEVLDLFLADVARDVTQKTGQKCTAIRRVYVPSARVDVVVERLVERLGRVKVGNTAHDDVTMGPVSTAQQLRDVRAGIERLGKEATLVLGGAAPVDAVGAAPGKGFFVAPTLAVAKGASATDAAHSHEVFGPVATVIPYDGTAADVGRMVAWGGGGLVTSIYADDKDFLRALVSSIGPWHGRLTIGSSKVAAQALPPGMVLPQLLHGGPGRAGGGEELGGLRGLAFYMQRTALQGDRAILEMLSGKR